MSSPYTALLHTYQEARLLLEAKGWALAKAAEALKLSLTTLSRKMAPGAQTPIEARLAVAIEAMPTWNGYERRVEIVTAGLQAVHGGLPSSAVDVRQLARELRECLPASEIASQLAAGLADVIEKIGSTPRRLRRQAGIWAAVALAAAGLSVALTPLLTDARARAPSDGPAVVIITRVEDGSRWWFERESLLALSEWGEKMPKRPAEQSVPNFTLPGQKVAPCIEEGGEEAINGNCWGRMDVKPPCGRYLWRHGDKCYRPIAAISRKQIGADH